MINRIINSIKLTVNQLFSSCQIVSLKLQYVPSKKKQAKIKAY